jgi:hypothetical protein
VLQRDLDKFNERFDRHFNQTRRFAIVGALTYGAVWIAILGAVGYVAWHFLQKVW